MRVTLDDDNAQLRHELREYFDGLLTDEVRAGLAEEGETGGPVTDRIRRQMGTDGAGPRSTAAGIVVRSRTTSSTPRRTRRTPRCP